MRPPTTFGNIEDSDVPAPLLDVGKALRAAREAAGLSVEEVAETSGLTTLEILEIEGGRIFDANDLRRVASALRISAFATQAP
jgi:transcriptional regulator with XRE-family HTH domain